MIGSRSSLLRQQLTAQFVTLAVVGTLWIAAGAVYLARLNAAADVRFAANRIRFAAAEVDAAAARVPHDPTGASLRVHRQAVSHLFATIEELAGLAPGDYAPLIDELRRRARAYEGLFDGGEARDVELRARVENAADTVQPLTESVLERAIADTRRARHELRLVTLLVLVLGFALGAVLALAFARRIAAPLAELERAAARIGHGALDTAVPGTGSIEVTELASALRRMTGDLRDSLGRFRLVARATNDVVWDWEAASGRLWYSDALEASFGWRTEGLDADHAWWMDRVHPDDRERVQGSLERAVGSAAPTWSAEYRFARADGRFAHVLDRGLVERDASGRVTRMIGAMMDISERQRAAEELQQARRTAEAASRAKSEFLANMSHEIRTPMNGILGMTELLLGTTLTRGQRESVDLIRQSAEALLDIINDILDFSKIEAGRIELEQRPFRLRDLLGDTLRTVGVRAHQKGLEIAYEVAADVPDALVGDPGRLRQVLVNLVGNAVKFTERGEIVVNTRARALEGDVVELEVAVRDTGIGIAPAKLARVFEAFEQADSSTTREYGGSGLGLTISRRLVEMMGGRLSVASEVARGSTFTFTTRLRRAPDAAAEAPPDLQDLAVLVVDDHDTSRRTLVQMLAGWGLAAMPAATEAEALRHVEDARGSRRPLDLALVDGRLDGTSGLALAARLAADMPVLLLATEIGQPPGAAENGIAEWLTKPVKQSDLLEAIQRVAGSRAGRVVAARGPRRSRRVKVLVAEDNRVNQRVVTGLLERAGHEVHLVGNGREAVDAVARERFDVVLMDVQMPEMDGFTATARIREREHAGGGPRQRIVAMTAHALKGDRERCLAAGMDGYVAKPLRVEQLLSAVQGPEDDPLPGYPPEPLGEEPVDEVAALAQAAGDPLLLREICRVFLDEAPRIAEGIGAALGQGDLAGARRHVHSLRGAMATLHARTASARAGALEERARAGDADGAREDWVVLQKELARVVAQLQEIEARG